MSEAPIHIDWTNLGAMTQEQIDKDIRRIMDRLACAPIIKNPATAGQKKRIETTTEKTVNSLVPQESHDRLDFED